MYLILKLLLLIYCYLSYYFTNLLFELAIRLYLCHFELKTVIPDLFLWGWICTEFYQKIWMRQIQRVVWTVGLRNPTVTFRALTLSNTKPLFIWQSFSSLHATHNFTYHPLPLSSFPWLVLCKHRQQHIALCSITPTPASCSTWWSAVE